MRPSWFSWLVLLALLAGSAGSPCWFCWLVRLVLLAGSPGSAGSRGWFCWFCWLVLLVLLADSSGAGWFGCFSWLILLVLLAGSPGRFSWLVLLAGSAGSPGWFLWLVFLAGGRTSKKEQNLGPEAPTELRKTLYIWCRADRVNYIYNRSLTPISSCGGCLVASRRVALGPCVRSSRAVHFLVSPPHGKRS